MIIKKYEMKIAFSLDQALDEILDCIYRMEELKPFVKVQFCITEGSEQ